jgi:PhoH-like ATPase
MLALDTNIILLDANNLLQLAKQDTILLAETVLDELDSKKSDLGELGYQAREFGRLMTQAIPTGTETRDSIIVSKFTIQDANIWVAASTSYPSFSDTHPNILNDRKIIYIAQQFQATVVSNDVMCRIRAGSLGLATTDFKLVESNDYEFTKHLTVDPATFSTSHRKPVAEIDPSYLPENYNYILTCSQTGQTKLATVINGLLYYLGKDTEDELRRQDVNPTNAEQLFLSRALQDVAIDLVTCEALAGSGKTATALSNGIRLVRQGKYDGILYIRASVNDVPKEEEVGFLSGNEEKFAVYLHPLDDTLDFIVRKRLANSKVKGADLDLKVESEIVELKTKCNIQAMTTLGMRGRTFHNMYVIIDEAQNQSQSSLQRVLTRFGKGCKVVLLGSLRQIDNPYITRFNSGLATVLEAARNPHEHIKMHAVTLHKVVRSPLAEWAEHLFSKQ